MPDRVETLASAVIIARTTRHSLGSSSDAKKKTKQATLNTPETKKPQIHDTLALPRVFITERVPLYVYMYCRL